MFLCTFNENTAGVPHDVQGGVQTDVQLPTVVQERPAAEVRLQEEVLHQVSRSLLFLHFHIRIVFDL